MSGLTFAICLLVALLVVPAILGTLIEGKNTVENYSGRLVASPGGIAVVATVVVSLAPIGALYALADVELLPSGLPTVAFYCLGVALLGLIDDVLPNTSRGWRGHGTALLSQGFSSGALKALGSLGLAFFVLGRGDRDPLELIVAVLLLLLATNLFNLLDLRPGRSIKSLLLFSVVVALSTRHWSAVAAVAPLVAPVLVFLRYDLKEVAMLGDTGSNLIGGLFGLLCVFSFSFVAQLVVLSLLIAVTAYAEVRSLSTLIESNPLLRRFDLLGRRKD